MHLQEKEKWLIKKSRSCGRNSEEEFQNVSPEERPAFGSVRIPVVPMLVGTVDGKG